MYKGYKVIVNTAAGRRRYMQYLFPQIISSDYVDQYDVWVNTNDALDIEFFKQMAQRFPKINLVWQPDNYVNGISSINAFYRSCVDKDTIYIKMDDDVVWLEKDYFKKMLDFRLDNPECFVVSPLVINNAVCTYYMQVNGKISLSKYMNAQSNHRIMWKRGNFAVELHHWFIKNYLNTQSFEQLYCGKNYVATNRFSINSILWFGRDMKAFDGVIEGDDEEFLSCIRPTQTHQYNAINGDALIAHFAFAPQRWILDKEGVLEMYADYLMKEWEEQVDKKAIFQSIKEIMADIEQRKDELMAQPARYNSPSISFSTKCKRTFKKYQRLVRYYLENDKNNPYIK